MIDESDAFHTMSSTTQYTFTVCGSLNVRVSCMFIVTGCAEPGEMTLAIEVSSSPAALRTQRPADVLALLKSSPSRPMFSS